MPVDDYTAVLLSDIAHRIRIHSIEATTLCNSGHPTSCSSSAEIFSVLFFNAMRYSTAEPKNPANDRFFLSKGHAAPALYASWAEAGLFPVDDLKNLRKIGHPLEGFPTPRLNFIDIASGSLGIGICTSAGIAYAAKYIDKEDFRTYCICGDGECAEGSVWEAMDFAGYYKLDNLVNIIDVNGLGQSQETMYQNDAEHFKAKCEAFGWHTIIVDGHSVKELVNAFDEARATKGKPTCILAKTAKGKHFPNVEHVVSYHGKPLGDHGEAAIKAVKRLMKTNIQKLAFEMIPIQAPDFKVDPVDIKNIKLSSPPDYKLGDSIATREAYGNGLVKIGKNNSRVIACDADMKNSTYSIKFRDAFPERYIECFIAEQNLASVAIGVATRDRHVVFASTFAAFWSRAYDMIRMGAVSQTDCNFVGSHGGCSIGEDGPSQMAMEDFAMFRAVPGSTIFYPTDAVATERSLELAANTKGICYVRLSRPAMKIIYDNDEVFEIGKAKVKLQSESDYATVVAGGVTVHEALKAAEKLKDLDKPIRVIDVFTVKPLDIDTILASMKETGNRIVVVEDHYEAGGIGDAVSSALLTHAKGEVINLSLLNVKSVPMSGKSQELLAHFKIDAASIQEAVLAF